MTDIPDISSMGNFDTYEIISNYLGVSVTAAIILLTLLSIWALVWKGFALWKSAKKTKLVWFIAVLTTNALGLFSIAYLFIFSKIKDMESFRKTHDVSLMLIVVLLALSFVSVGFIVPLAFIWWLFSVSIIQEALNNKEWTWMILGIILIPIVPIIYYLTKIRDKKSLK